MSNDVVYWINIAGSIASLFGVPFAIWQIHKVKRAADAAREAANQTQKTISKNLLLADVNTCIKNLGEIQLFVQVERYESAQLRATDLVSYLYQIQQRTRDATQLFEIEFEEMFPQLDIIREIFEKKINGSSANINKVRVNMQLSKISGDLNKLVGETVIAIEKGEQNG